MLKTLFFITTLFSFLFAIPSCRSPEQRRTPIAKAAAHRAKELFGSKLTRGGKPIGKVEDFVVDLEGDVKHVVVSLDGSESKKHLSPSALSMLEHRSVEDREFVLLDDAALLDTPTSSETKPSNLYRLSEIIGSMVKTVGLAGRRLGRIDDLLVDMQGSRVLCAAVSVGGIAGVGERIVAVPWTMVHMQREGAFHFALSEDKLTDAPVVPAGPLRTHWIATVFSYYRE